MNPLFSFFKFLYNDLKGDILFFKKIITNPSMKPKLKLEELFDDFDITLKENWLWFLIIILAFLSGLFVSGKYYQNECNNFIYNNYLLNISQYAYDNVTTLLFK